MPFDLFPPLEPHASGMMAADDLHTLYWEECGNPEGVPVIFLHGGPGAGATPTHRRFFNPADWRIVIFDQRGAGRSQPVGETRQNTIEHLIADIEKLRVQRGIERWHVFGGSWGSTLALAYAEAHPDKCLSLMLRGVCLWRRSEIDWFFYGIRNFFPEMWQQFAGQLPISEQHNLCEGYWKLFHSSDPSVRRNAINAWCDYENFCSTLLPIPEPVGEFNHQQRLGMALIECHYFRSQVFAKDNQLLLDIERIRHIPGVIVQGRYDAVCPPVSAYDLKQAWPEARLKIVPDAGHSGLEPGIRGALVEATEHFKTIK